MSNDLMLDVGQANELKLAFRRADYSNDDIKRLCEGNVLADVRRVLHGYASIVAIEAIIDHIIDCNAYPFIPDGSTVEEHQKGGVFRWDKDAQKDALYLSKGQAGSKYIGGNELRREFWDKSTPVLNANVLDYLLANPHLIPKEWEGKCVFFWGTVYRARGNLCVRYLYWIDGEWSWSARRFGCDWDGDGPAAVRAS